jgi:3-oxoacyl-[acyl-carrier protein] reductase
MSDLSGRVVIITGAARGLGRDFARLFAADGAHVVLADVKDAEKARADAEAQGPRCIAVPTDITDNASVEALMARTKAEFGGLDVLINNAALWREPESVGIVNCTEEIWDATFQVNLKGQWLCYRAAAPLLRERGRGRIINVSTTASAHGANIYGVSKCALELMTKGMAREMGPHRVTVNSIVPGICAFSGAKGQLPGFDQVLARIPTGRVGTSEDLYAAMAYLCSDAASYVTGENMTLDGGLSAN